MNIRISNSSFSKRLRTCVRSPRPPGSNTTRFLRHVQRGTLGPFAPPGSLSVVGVADVARGIRLALERGRHGRRYLLCESNLTLRELQTRAARVLGVRPPLASVPPWLWRGVVGAVSLASLQGNQVVVASAVEDPIIHLWAG